MADDPASLSHQTALRASSEDELALISDEQQAQVRRYTELLLKWNRKINLTRITGETEIRRHHFGEAFLLSRLLPASAKRLVDIGSGAGFPGLAVKIARPDIHVTLLEASSKKCAFLREVIAALGFSRDADVVSSRLEDYEPPDTLFDVATMRGVSLTPGVAKKVSALLKPGGSWFIITSADRVQTLRGGALKPNQWRLSESALQEQRVVLKAVKCFT